MIHEHYKKAEKKNALARELAYFFFEINAFRY